MSKKTPEYRVEFSKADSGLKGYSVLNRKGKEFRFDESKIEAEQMCEALNDQHGKRPKKNNLKEAVGAAEQFVQKIVKEPCVKIYTFKDKQGGVRVAEVSVTDALQRSGSSWMRSEAESGGIILAVEEFLLTFGVRPYVPKGWETALDVHADAQFRLKTVLE